ncbi:MAG: sulfatase modifying factor 1, partial [Myxococcota bacterium]
CYPDEQPAHMVTLGAFRIDVHEVTVGAYRTCVDAAACTEPSDLSNADCSYPIAERENYPVNCITWQQAREYCAFVDGRLPTEAEWERAARGTDGRPYAWGEEEISCEHANYSGCQLRARPVGCHAAGVSPEGLHDTAGNVAEFTADWFDNTWYKTSPETNPSGPESGEHPVVRGGSYYDFPDFQRATFRGYDDDTAAKPFDYIGIRCAYSE